MGDACLEEIKTPVKKTKKVVSDAFLSTHEGLQLMLNDLQKNLEEARCVKDAVSSSSQEVLEAAQLMKQIREQQFTIIGKMEAAFDSLPFTQEVEE